MNFDTELNSFKKGFNLLIYNKDVVLLYLVFTAPNILLNASFPLYANNEILRTLLGFINIIFVFLGLAFNFYFVKLITTRLNKTQRISIFEFFTIIKRLLLPIVLFTVVNATINLGIFWLLTIPFPLQTQELQTAIFVWGILYAFLLTLLLSLAPMYYVLENNSFWISLEKSFQFLTKHPKMLLLMIVVSVATYFALNAAPIHNPWLKALLAIAGNIVNMGVLASLLIYYLHFKKHLKTK
jgi:hypothetical protein